jgi:hypothetical protein
MQQDALLRSRLLSTFHTESKARRSYQQLSGLGSGTPGSGVGDEDGPLGGFQPPQVAPVVAEGGSAAASSGVAAPSTSIDGGGGGATSSLAAAAAAATHTEAAAAAAAAAAGGGSGNGDKARGRSISFSLSLAGSSSARDEPQVAAGAGMTVPTPGSVVAGPAERYTTLDLFPDYPEQFLPQVQDFQRVIILNTPEPPDSDTQAACKQLRKAMKLRSKWLGVPLEPEAHVGGGAGGARVMGSVAAEQQARAESPTFTHAPSQPPSSPGSPRWDARLSRRVVVVWTPCVFLALNHTPGTNTNTKHTTHTQTRGRRTQAYNRMKRRQSPPYDPFAYEPPAASKHRIELVDGVYNVSDEGGERVSDVLSVDDFYDDFHELSVRCLSLPTRPLVHPSATRSLTHPHTHANPTDHPEHSTS